MLEDHIKYVQISFNHLNDMTLRIVVETINSVVNDDEKKSNDLYDIKADYDCLITPVNRNYADSSNGALYLYEETSPNDQVILWVDDLDDFIIHLNDEYSTEFEKHRALLTTKLGSLL